jgi:hypothetical protein
VATHALHGLKGTILTTFIFKSVLKDLKLILEWKKWPSKLSLTVDNGYFKINWRI